MKYLGKWAAAAIFGSGLILGFAGSASAGVVCNEDGECWHTRTEYTYPPSVRLSVHPDDWRWKDSDKYSWREHEGRGYWRDHAWTEF